MAENSTQNFASHTRWHAPFHFFLMPGALLLLVLTIVNIVKHQTLEAWILLLIGVLTPIAYLLTRINPLKAQDRVIRLEERMRLQALLNDPLRARIADLNERQLVALRFASDGELAGLVDQALKNGWKPADIKKAIVTWRPDTFRV